MLVSVNGKTLAANFSVEKVGADWFVRLESRGGKLNTPSVRNPDYSEALKVIITRLCSIDAVMVDAQVDSDKVRRLDLSPDERRVMVPDFPFPVSLGEIQDPAELAGALGRGQVPIGRAVGAKGGNHTKRLMLRLQIPGVSGAWSLADYLVSDVPLQGLAEPTKDIRLGPMFTYRQADENVSISECDPFAVDPALVERGLRGHATTQNLLAQMVAASDLCPLSPAPSDPSFDLAWEQEGCLFVAEVKSVTRENEEKQLRLGLGQVLRFAHLLKLSRRYEVKPVLALEREPTDRTWKSLCRDLGVFLVWPEVFTQLLPAR